MTPIRRMLAAALCAAAVSGIAAGALAQDATPVSGLDALEALNASDVPAIGNELRAGTCDDFAAEAAVQLAPAEFQGAAFSAAGIVSAEGTPEAVVSAIGIPVSVGTTAVELPIADIIEGGHVLVVHDAVDESIITACGVVGGRVDRNGNLFIGLEPRNDSGIAGIAWLKETDGSTSVTVMLARLAVLSQETPGFVTGESDDEAGIPEVAATPAP